MVNGEWGRWAGSALQTGYPLGHAFTIHPFPFPIDRVKLAPFPIVP